MDIKGTSSALFIYFLFFWACCVYFVQCAFVIVYLLFNLDIKWMKIFYSQFFFTYLQLCGRTCHYLQSVVDFSYPCSSNRILCVPRGHILMVLANISLSDAEM